MIICNHSFLQIKLHVFIFLIKFDHNFDINIKLSHEKK